ncbi:MAG: CHAT domain-containing protein, partial [Bacteroidota bacterium]
GKEQANVANYRQLIEQVQVLHSSHHASSRLDNPLESQLQLADGTISLGEIMSPGWRVPNLTDVFLSCCETNLGFAQLSDDPLTLGTGFLCAGARSVVSTLWSVEDMATALFSIIYYELRNSDLDRSTALQQAQRRLRNLSGTELDETYYPKLHQYLTTRFKQAETNRKQAKQKLEQLNKETSEYTRMETEKKQWSKVANELRRSIQRLEQATKQPRPFAHPYYWAGFISQGLR